MQMPRFGNIWICCLMSWCPAKQHCSEHHQPTFPSASCFVFLSPWIVFGHLSDDTTREMCLFGRHLANKRPNKPQTCQHHPSWFVRKIWKCQKTCLETTDSLGLSPLPYDQAEVLTEQQRNKEKDHLLSESGYFAAPPNAWFQAEMSCHLSPSCQHKTHPDRPPKTQSPSITISQRAAFVQ